MAKEWTDDEVSALISDAVRIVREDKFEAFVRGLSTKTNDNQNGGNDQPGNAGNNSGTNNPPPKAKKSLWWGESTE